MEHFKPPVLLLVAHWDDEILSSGGTLKKHGKGWDVVCTTIRDHHPQYQNVFNEVCISAGANPVTLPIYHRTVRFKDTNLSIPEFCRTAKRVVLTEELITNSFKKVNIDINKYNTVVTHHTNGDFGRHQHHIQLSHVAFKIFKGKTIYQFVIPSPGIISADNMHKYFVENSNCIVKLNQKELTWKWRSMRKYKSGVPIILGALDEEAYVRMEV